MIGRTGNPSAEIKRTDKEKHSGYDEYNILEKPWNEYPWRKNEEYCYETFDSKW